MIMKHRHTRQQQRPKPASRNRRLEVDKTADEQPFSSAANTKKRAAHSMKAEGGKTKPRLDKFRRGGRQRPKKYDDGGTVSGYPVADATTADPIVDAILNIPSTQRQLATEGMQQMGRGVGQIESGSGDPREVANGVGNVALGGMGYVGSWPNAALRGIVGKGLANIRQQITDYQNQTATKDKPQDALGD
jgi:hypothetical protein